MPKIIALVDLDAFFASCEELRHPDYKGKPLLVCVRPRKEGGAVATCNYAARKYGVHSGMPLKQAEKLIPNSAGAAIVDVDHEYYSEISEKVMEILHSFADSMEQVSVDEAFLDLTKKANGDFSKAQALCQELKEKIKSETGLTCSIGISYNKLLAKMASEMKKPDGLTPVPREKADGFLLPLPVGKLYFVGSKTADFLKSKGIVMVAQLRGVDIGSLIGWFGNSLGKFLYQLARGIYDDRLSPPSEEKGMSRITTLQQNTRDPAEVSKAIDSASADLAERITQRKANFKSVSVTVFLSDLSVITKTRTSKAYLGPSRIAPLAKSLATGLLSSTKKDFRRIGVGVGKLDFSEKQASLANFN